MISFVLAMYVIDSVPSLAYRAISYKGLDLARSYIVTRFIEGGPLGA